MEATAFAQDLTKYPTPESQNQNPDDRIQTLSKSKGSPSSRWSYSVKNCISQKRPKAAILIYTRNRGNGSVVIGVIPSVLKACASVSMLSFGKALHSEIVKSGVEGDVMVGNSLVAMYGKCQDLVSSRKVFDHMPERDAVTWTAMIGGCMRNGDKRLASILFENMAVKDSVTWIEMIDGYVRNGDMVMARRLFESVPESLKNEVTWAVYVRRYDSLRNCISQKRPKEAILTYTRNRGYGSVVIGVIPLVLKACASLSMLSFGKALHSEIVKSGVEGDVMVGTSLVGMYGECQDLVSSRKVFDHMPERNAFTCSEMIDGYARNGDMVMARRLFESVPESLKDVVTWSVLVRGYVSNGDMEAAMKVFERMKVRNSHTWTVVITGYFKKGDVLKAREIFDEMSLRELVHWNSLISGYAQNGMCKEALDAYMRMRGEGIEPNEFTLVGVLSACAQSGMLDFGKEIHEMILKKKMEIDASVLNGLVNMYAKCGDLENARLIFEGMTVKSTVTWNSLIGGFAIHGQGREAIEFFSRMEESGAKPNCRTFQSFLSACAHGGFVEEGLEAFSKMEKYGLEADIKHYGCLVDLLGRAGKLQDAFDLVKGMPMAPDHAVLTSLLGACRIHCHTLMAENVLELFNQLSYVSYDGKDHVQISNIYKASERWEMAERMQVGVFEKTPACSTLTF